MDGLMVGVFGTDPELKSSLETSVAKKSEAGGISVYTRTDGGRRYSLLDTDDFPARIQGYARIASFADHSLFMFPKSGKLAASDGELAVLLGALGVPGTLVVTDGSTSPDAASSSLRGTTAAAFRVEERQAASGSMDLSAAVPRPDLPKDGTLIYVDRVFTVKGVGTVALGFVLSGSVALHDQLRPIPGPEGLRADVKGIQVSDVDFDTAGRGIRVGLSLRGVEPKDLDRTRWLDAGTLRTSDTLAMSFSPTPFYRLGVESRDLHVQLPGEMVPARIEKSGNSTTAKLPYGVPVWEGMRGAIIDLNGGPLRVAGGFEAKF